MARPSRAGGRGSGSSRRDVLRAAGVGMVGLTAGGTLEAASFPARSERSLILLLLVGGPSQLETWDPKPDAPVEIRGPFGSIATRVPGVRFCEHLPRLARRMDRFSLIRSLHHDAAPIHETGFQLLQTGRLCRLGDEHPGIGAVATRLLRGGAGLPPAVVLPNVIGNTGVSIANGQGAGRLGAECEPLVIDPEDGAGKGRLAASYRRALDLANEPARARDAFGSTRFGQSCLRARRLVEAGARLVVVNMYSTVFHEVSWDCHASAPFSSLEDYRREVLPTLDVALSALLDDLAERGLLETTMVAATGEFGRSPKLNPAGGRDHWPGVWSALVAGGGTSPGQVIGASDAHAAEPVDRPVTPPELLATLYRGLGIDTSQTLALTDGARVPILDQQAAITELLA